MTAEIRVRETAATREFSESEVFERTVERGFEALVLAQYLAGELDCAATIDHVGRGTIERAD